MNRVVITGMGGLSPLGNDWSSIKASLLDQKSGIKYHDSWSDIIGLQARLAGFVDDRPFEDLVSRKDARLLSRTSLLAIYAAKQAIEEAKISSADLAERCDIGIAYGSCLGGAEQLMNLGSAIANKSLQGVLASSFLQVMTHASAAALAMHFKLHGRIIPTSCACTSSSQAIGYAYETIKHQQANVMLAGGADELCVGTVAMFDRMQALSKKTAAPSTTPAPFDLNRDGIVISEGASCFVLENLDHALARKAPIYAEIISFETSCDGCHITQPNEKIITATIRKALNNANIKPKELAFAHAHATGTTFGDAVESAALASAIGSEVCVTATKGYQGHTLAAAGGLEALISISSCREGWIPRIKNLDTVDPQCGSLDYCLEERSTKKNKVLVSNFAFGGVNASLVYEVNNSYKR